MYSRRETIPQAASGISEPMLTSSGSDSLSWRRFMAADFELKQIEVKKHLNFGENKRRVVPL